MCLNRRCRYLNNVSGLALEVPPVPRPPSFDTTPPHGSGYSVPHCKRAASSGATSGSGCGSGVSAVAAGAGATATAAAAAAASSSDVAALRAVSASALRGAGGRVESVSNTAFDSSFTGGGGGVDRDGADSDSDSSAALLFCDDFDTDAGEVASGLWQWQRNQSASVLLSQPWNTTYLEAWAPGGGKTVSE
jgi:hypothetical protein